MGKLSENFFKSKQVNKPGSLSRGYFESRGQNYEDVLSTIKERQRKKEEERIRQSIEISRKEMEEKNKIPEPSLLEKSKAVVGSLFEGFKNEFLPKIKNKSKILKDTLAAEGRLVSGIDLTNPEQLKKDIQQNIEFGKGMVKNAGELASGTAKLATGIYTGKLGRKIGKKIFGEETYNKYTPEFLRSIDAKIDESGILNYKPEYSNEIQKTGGDVAELASWFIPITRISGVGKIEKAISEIPKVAEFLGSKPRLVKSGGKFFYEVTKDAVDAGVLDLIRGKDWESIKQDMEMAGMGGAVLRGSGKIIAKAFEKSKTNKIVATIKNSFGELTQEETKIVKESASQGKAIDEIINELSKTKETIEPSVIQIVNKKTGSKTFKTIKSGELENYQKLIDDTKVGIAGQEINDKVYHLTAKNPQQMEEQGFKNMGEAQFSDIPATKEALEIIKPKITTTKKTTIKPKQKTAKVASDINIRLAKSGFNEVPEEELAKYTPITKEKTIQRVAEELEDYDKSIRMSLGREKIPNDVERQPLFNAVVNRAIKEGDHELLESLAKSPLATERSLLAQKLGSAGYNIDKTSPINTMQDIVKTRTEDVTKKMGKPKIDKELKQVQSTIEKKIKKSMPTKDDWNKFLTEIQC